MSDDKEELHEKERKELEDDIERLQNVLEGYESDESDGENQRVNSRNEEAVAGSSKSWHENDSSAAAASPSRHDDFYIEEAGESEEEGGVSYGGTLLASALEDSPEMCLALNRAYQEMLTEILQQIEQALTVNRQKQSELEQNLTEKQLSLKTRCITGTQNSIYVKSLKQFGFPFFKDTQGRPAPPNSDVALKSKLNEQKMDISHSQQWKLRHKNVLKDAVARECLGILMRPLMNKKEIELAKLINANKEEKKEIKAEINKKISDLDQEIDTLKKMPTSELLKEVDTDKLDWMKISAMDFEGRFDSDVCRKTWNLVVNPNICQDKWSCKESQHLQKLAKKYEQREWDKIAEELGTNRTAVECLKHYQLTFSEQFFNRPWTQEEDEILQNKVEDLGSSKIQWQTVSYYIEGRGPTQCASRWNQINPNVKHGKWTAEEDCALMAAIQIHGMDWDKIQKLMDGRSKLQCREHYQNVLDPSLKSPYTWTLEEDQILLQLAKKYTREDTGTIQWVKVAQGLNGRTDNMIMYRYRRLMKWKRQCEWLESQDKKARDVIEANLTEKEKMKLKRFQTDGYFTFSTGLAPRPPQKLPGTRSTQKSKSKKWNIQDLIAKHLKTKLSFANTSVDKKKLVEEASQAFAPFSKMTPEQKDRLHDILQMKGVQSISVSNILHLSKSLEESVKKPRKPSKGWAGAVCPFEQSLLNIVAQRLYTPLIFRNKSMRHKKFYLFCPFGKKPVTGKYKKEFEAQNKTIATSLLIKALKVNGFKCLENASKINEDVLTITEHANKELLKKMFPPLPASIRIQQLNAKKAQDKRQPQKINGKGIASVATTKSSAAAVTSTVESSSVMSTSNNSSKLVTGTAMSSIAHLTKSAVASTTKFSVVRNPNCSSVPVTQSLSLNNRTRSLPRPVTNTSASSSASALATSVSTSSAVKLSSGNLNLPSSSNNLPSSSKVIPLIPGPGGNTKVLRLPPGAPIPKFGPNVKVIALRPPVPNSGTVRPATPLSSVSGNSKVISLPVATKVGPQPKPVVNTLNEGQKGNSPAQCHAPPQNLAKEKAILEVKGHTIIKGNDSSLVTVGQGNSAACCITPNVNGASPAGTVGHMNNTQIASGSGVQANNGNGMVQSPGPCASTSVLLATNPEADTLTGTTKRLLSLVPSASVSKTTPSSTSVLKQSLSTPAVIIKKAKRDMPLLPPTSKTLEAFAGLLLQKPYLENTAGEKYNKPYYWQRARLLKEAESSAYRKQTGKSIPFGKSVFDKLTEFLNPGSLEFNFKCLYPKMDTVKGTSGKKSKKKKNDSVENKLREVRTSDEYALLKKRFQAMFLWPALLSTTKGPMMESERRRFKQIVQIAKERKTKTKTGRKFYKLGSFAHRTEKNIENSKQALVNRILTRIERKKKFILSPRKENKRKENQGEKPLDEQPIRTSKWGFRPRKKASDSSCCPIPEKRKRLETLDEAMDKFEKEGNVVALKPIEGESHVYIQNVEAEDEHMQDVSSSKGDDVIKIDPYAEDEH